MLKFYYVMNFNIEWHVFYVKSRWEKKVYESLQKESLKSFLPQMKTNSLQQNITASISSYYFEELNTSQKI